MIFVIHFVKNNHRIFSLQQGARFFLVISYDLMNNPQLLLEKKHKICYDININTF